MRKIRGFRVRPKLVKVFKWVIHTRKPKKHQQRLKRSSCASKAMSKLCDWGRSLKKGAIGLCCSKPKQGYIRVGGDPVERKPVGVPKGHMAVYVGEGEVDTMRILVPVIYFNHPLFVELLREAEKVYGFDHSGGIQIPCRISEFENLQTKIAAAGGNCRRRRSWRHQWW